MYFMQLKGGVSWEISIDLSKTFEKGLRALWVDHIVATTPTVLLRKNFQRNTKGPTTTPTAF